MTAVADFEQKRIVLSTGVTLDVVDIGPRAAPVLIFLHGFPESHRTWRYQLAHFSQEYRCIAPDQRGYCGASKPPKVTDYNPDKLTEDIFALADALDIAQFTIVGHDWGGAIAWNVALKGQPLKDQPLKGQPLTEQPLASESLKGQPTILNSSHIGRVTRAIIANAPHPSIFQNLLFTDRAQRAASQYVRAFRDTAHDALIREQGLIGLLAKVMGRDAAPKQEIEERNRLHKNWQDSATAFAMLNWYRASPIIVPPTDSPPLSDHGTPTAKNTDKSDSWRDFPKVNIPTLVVWGMEDTALLPSNLNDMAHFVPRVKLVRLAGYGHFIPWQAPQAVIAAMHDFLTPPQ